MNGRLATILSAGLGAGLMYMLDPQRGRRRRAMVRDGVVHGWHKAGEAVDVTSRDLANRGRGVRAQVRSWMTREQVSDTVLEQRVRAHLGRVVAHPSSLEVKSEDGCVTLKGPVLAHELGRLLRRVWSVRGVKKVENLLEVHDQSGSISGLQGEPSRRGEPHWEFMQSNWSPAARFLAGMAGGALAIYGAAGNRGVRSAVLGSAGVTMLTRAVSNMGLADLTGIGRGARGIEVKKTISIEAPIDRVFSLWSNFEAMPQFMTHVREVTRLDLQRTHWVVDGPAGRPVEWDAVTTELIPLRLIAWKTEPGSPVQHTGTVHFTGRPEGTTTIDVHLSYRPVGGGVGHLIASLFGADPHSRINDDLMRMKRYVETGIAPRDAAEHHG